MNKAGANSRNRVFFSQVQKGQDMMAVSLEAAAEEVGGATNVLTFEEKPG